MTSSKLKTSFIGALAIGALTLASAAQALMLSISPTPQDGMPGDTVVFDLVASGLGAFGAPSIGDFDLILKFDPAALSFEGYTLGSDLGDPSFFEAIDDSLGDLGGGLVDLAEVSLLLPIELDILQDDSFMLAMLEFKVATLAVGDETHISFETINAIGDGLGNPFIIDDIGTARGTIRNPNTQVPAPATALLFLVGLAALRSHRRNL